MIHALGSFIYLIFMCFKTVPDFVRRGRVSWQKRLSDIEFRIVIILMIMRYLQEELI